LPTRELSIFARNPPQYSKLQNLLSEFQKNPNLSI
jgi:hypothetical protein